MAEGVHSSRVIMVKVKSTALTSHLCSSPPMPLKTLYVKGLVHVKSIEAQNPLVSELLKIWSTSLGIFLVT
ncbi:hypothetical protein TNCV_3556941 [Trichonephila clavipes]|uniref:Uncharacterized protein n=1 Tax=Trichonephila clavipes TaxID=2585209 RepID=A0A8X6WDP6_TRICX|nr:hypothetical protein TNCV_3556941 [Trichonephila clavipes]